MLWGGLRPIRSRLLLDVISLACYVRATWMSIPLPERDYERETDVNATATIFLHLFHSYIHQMLIIGSFLLTVVTAGNVTNRWTMVLPVVPVIVLQGLRHIYVVARHGENQPMGSWVVGIFSIVSTAFIFVAAILSVLFPAVELPPVQGPYQVGVVEFFLPVGEAQDQKHGPSHNGSDKINSNIDNNSDSSTLPIPRPKYIPVRLLYPTQPTHQSTFFSWRSWRGIRYLNARTAVDYCKTSIQVAMPSSMAPFNSFGWILHTWRLTKLRNVRWAAPLATTTSHFSNASAACNGNFGSSPNSLPQFPVVIYSHGLLGNPDIYSFQTTALAAQGYIVLVLTHSDGSSPAVPQIDGTNLPYNRQFAKLETIPYVRARRQCAEYRSSEMIVATEAFLTLNSRDVALLGFDNLPVVVPSLQGRLLIDSIFFMGHSFGGATAFTAALRRPDLVKAVVTHDPAIDWCPDDVRQSLLDSSRLHGVADLPRNYLGGSGGYESTSDESEQQNSSHDTFIRRSLADSGSSSLHEKDLFILYSHEWWKKNWGESDLLMALHRVNRVGPTISNLSDSKKGGLARTNSSVVDVIQHAHHQEFSDTCMMIPLWLARGLGMTGKRNPIDTATESANRTLEFLKSQVDSQ